MSNTFKSTGPSYYYNIFSTSFNCHNIQNNIVPDSIKSIFTDAMTTEVISDKDGNLLFIADQSNIYNSDYKMMKGGKNATQHRMFGLAEFGRFGDTKTIVPQPGKGNIYNIFFANSLHNNPSPLDSGDVSLNRTIIDMNIDNGKGAVIRKYTNLFYLSNKGKDGNAYHCITVVKAANNTDYWILSTESDTIKSFLLTKDSFSVKPVKSVLKNNSDEEFHFHISNNGKYFIPNRDDSIISIYKFNTNTGKVDFSNSFFSFSLPSYIQNPQFNHMASIKYSPDESKLYICCFSYDSNLMDIIFPLYQYDLSSGDSLQIAQSLKLLKVNQKDEGSFVGMAIGMDSKVYLGFIKHNPEKKFSFLINNPNEINPDISKLDFTMLHHHYHRGRISRTSPISKFYISHSCLKEPIKFTLAARKNADSFFWNFGDILSGVNNTSCIKEPEHTFMQPGRYKVILVTCEDGIYDTSGLYLCLYDSIEKIDIRDTNLCYSEKLVFDARNNGATYLWSTGDTTQQITIVDTGLYSLEISKGTCHYSLDFEVKEESINYQLLSSEDTVFCEISKIKTTAPTPFYSFLWNNGDTSVSLTPLNSGLFTVTAKKRGCTIKDSIMVNLILLPKEFLPTDTTFCEGEEINLTAKADNVSYNWSTGSYQKSITITQSGVYTLKISDNKCYETDSTEVIMYENPKPDLGPDLNFCPKKGETILLDGGNFVKWLWIPSNSTDRKIYLSQPDTYYLFVENVYGCKNSDTIIILENCKNDIYIPNAFSPNGDGINDTFDIGAEGINEKQIKIYNRWGERIFESKDKFKGWDGTFKGNNCKIDVYYYYITVQRKEEEAKIYSGTVTLVR
ncbi:MAG: gliding motility-associated C-terminal domain-containing protein [Bacteroidota bacterium]|nr:gliding motility-associated C-terminal domain-containing protein [Bacteroidota bacterium]